MTEKFILMDLSDERSKKISEVLGNKTCKKIIDFLAEKEASEKDIADALSIPINTVEYNLNKLIESGLIEKAKTFFWSVKGRKIDMYRLSNKKILISPKTLIKGVIPSLIALGLGAFVIKIISDNQINQLDVSGTAGSGVSDSVVSNAPSAAEKVASSIQSYMPPPQNISNVASFISTDAWAWFLLGGLFVILIFLLWNQYKKMKGGF